MKFSETSPSDQNLSDSQKCSTHSLLLSLLIYKTVAHLILEPENCAMCKVIISDKKLFLLQFLSDKWWLEGITW